MKSVDVCVLIYGNRSEDCLNFLESLDYPKEFLSVTVFSDRAIKHPYKTQQMPQKDAYNFIAQNCNATYTWILNAGFVINNGTILKDLLKANKNIVSGLMIKNNTAFSNFWGKLSPTGWYARSDDYIDIYELKKKGCFKVPYITGNVLYKTEVLKNTPDLTKEHNKWELDMNICHNLRAAGQELYLLNNAVYGFVEDTVG